MKRNIVFLTVLTVLTLTVTFGELFYTSNFKKEAGKLLDACADSLSVSAVDDFKKLIEKNEFFNNTFYPKDIIKGISTAVRRAKSFIENSAIAEAAAEFECIRGLIEKLC